ncbi:uncharacterized protein LOC102681416 isoform X2 [Apis dorsata]|uniref:uncharacterized protein LOC102681416 isoform X2 n=1 Tax=Apis dorsata TaxID=7462 RepID=UPI0003DF753B|nr:uncharacterized protein LOC102681416 isoform X2 [Apis dorsata]
MIDLKVVLRMKMIQGNREDNRESLRDRSRSQIVNRWQFVLEGKNKEGLDQSPCGWYVQNTKRSCTHGPECQCTEFLDDFPQLFSCMSCFRGNRCLNESEQVAN